MNMFKSILSIAVVSLNFELCFTGCARAEYEINGECCPMCAPGNRVYWQCTVDTSTTCIPCPASTYIDEPNGLTKCFACSVCDASHGLKVSKVCTRSADSICEPLDGFYCTEKKKGGCALAIKHSTCNPGQYIKQTATAFTDTVCGDCTNGTYSNGSFTYCQPHLKCETVGLREIKPGTPSSDTECGKSVSIGLIAGVTVAVLVLIGLLVTYLTLKQKIQQFICSTCGCLDSHPVMESNISTTDHTLEPNSPDSMTPFMLNLV